MQPHATSKAIWLRGHLDEVYKNLPEIHMDTFDSVGDFEVRLTYSKPDTIARTRVVHSSCKDNKSDATIHACTHQGTLAIKYSFLVHNTDEWVSYVIQGFSDEIGEYLRKGYYLSFTAFSKEVEKMVLETRDPEMKTNVLITPEPSCHCYKLKDLIQNINGFRELCFVIRPFTENELEGTLEISNLKLLRKSKAG